MSRATRQRIEAKTVLFNNASLQSSMLWKHVEEPVRETPRRTSTASSPSSPVSNHSSIWLSRTRASPVSANHGRPQMQDGPLPALQSTSASWEPHTVPPPSLLASSRTTARGGGCLPCLPGSSPASWLAASTPGRVETVAVMARAETRLSGSGLLFILACDGGACRFCLSHLLAFCLFPSPYSTYV